MRRTKKYGKALWVGIYPEQMGPNNAVLAGKLKARYELKKKRFMAKHQFCQACPKFGVNPPRLAQQCHHIFGRLRHHLLDDTKFLAVCAQCHLLIHSSIEVSRKLGLIAPKGRWNH